MKLSRKARIIGLSIMICAAIAVSGFSLWHLLSPKEDKPDTPEMEDTAASKVYKEMLIYEETSGLVGVLTDYNGELGIQEGSSIVNIDTKETILEIPPEWFEKWPNGLRGYSLSDDGTFLP